MLPDSNRERHAGDGEDERVRRRAYDIWEREGRPHGRDEEHWRMARQEIAREARGAGQTQTVPATRADPSQSETARARQPAAEERSSGTQADPLGVVQGESAGSGAGISDHIVGNTATAASAAKAKRRTAKPRAGRARKADGSAAAPGGPGRPR